MKKKCNVYKDSSSYIMHGKRNNNGEAIEMEIKYFFKK